MLLKPQCKGPHADGLAGVRVVDPIPDYQAHRAGFDLVEACPTCSPETTGLPSRTMRRIDEILDYNNYSQATRSATATQMYANARAGVRLIRHRYGNAVTDGSYGNHMVPIKWNRQSISDFHDTIAKTARKMGAETTNVDPSYVGYLGWPCGSGLWFVRRRENRPVTSKKVIRIKERGRAEAEVV